LIMAITDLNKYREVLDNATSYQFQTDHNTNLIAGVPYFLWAVGGPNGVAGATPTVPVVCTSTTTGALRQKNGSEQRIMQLNYGTQTTGIVIVCDRLSHQAGLVGDVTTEQFTNLPTAPLTRYTSGEGVMIALEIYHPPGNTTHNIAVNYINQDGNPAVGKALIGGSTYRGWWRSIWVTLADGDTGARSVTSVQLPFSTGGAGNFGVTLVRPLCTIEVGVNTGMVSDFIMGGMQGAMAKVEDDACLSFVFISATSVGRGYGHLLIGDV